MSFQNYLESLRDKPEHIRKRFAFWTSFGITVVIFAFWLSSFTASVVGPQDAVSAAVARAGSPGDSLIAGVGNFFKDIKEMVFGAKKITYKEVEVLPGKK